MKLIKRSKNLTYDDYCKAVYGKSADTGRRKTERYHSQAQRPRNTPRNKPVDTRLLWDSPEAVNLLNEAIGTITSAKITEELAKNDYKESKMAVLKSLSEKVQATKEELAAIVKVAEAKAKDNVLNLDDNVQAVMRVLELDSNNIQSSDDTNDSE